jgi:hypothetical protein
MTEDWKGSKTIENGLERVEAEWGMVVGIENGLKMGDVAQNEWEGLKLGWKGLKPSGEWW